MQPARLSQGKAANNTHNQVTRRLRVSSSHLHIQVTRRLRVSSSHLHNQVTRRLRVSSSHLHNQVTRRLCVSSSHLHNLVTRQLCVSSSHLHNQVTRRRTFTIKSLDVCVSVVRTQQTTRATPSQLSHQTAACQYYTPSKPQEQCLCNQVHQTAAWQPYAPSVTRSPFREITSFLIIWLSHPYHLNLQQVSCRVLHACGVAVCPPPPPPPPP